MMGNAYDSMRDEARSQNNYYEALANSLNHRHGLGYNNQNIDALKHTIASADQTIRNGSASTYSIGLVNELVAAARNRDGFYEHNKDIHNNITGMAVAGWLQENLSRPVTLNDVLNTTSVLSRAGGVRLNSPENGKGKKGIGAAILSSILGTFWSPHLEKASYRNLDLLRNEISEVVPDLQDSHLQCFPIFSLIQITSSPTYS